MNTDEHGHMSGTVQSVGRDHLHRVFTQVLDWYKSADAKAQVILTLDGAFITFLCSAVFGRPDEVRLIIGAFKPDTWLLLGLMCLTLTGSIVAAICCLWSRIYSEHELVDAFTHAHTDPNVAASYAPEVMSFFQHVSRLKPEALAERLGTADADFDRLALSHEVVNLARNVARKHAWVNRAFVLAALSVCLFLGAAATYILHL